MRLGPSSRRPPLAGMLAFLAVAASARVVAAARFELVTVGPDDVSAATRFGHAALCMFSARYPRGACINYGVSDFRRGNLVPAILLGTADFWMEAKAYDYSLRTYVAEDRDIFRQSLPLRDDEADALEARVMEEIAHARRPYAYNPFHDNCTTRLRDLLDVVTRGRLSASASEIASATYRTETRRAMRGSGLLLAGADFALGDGDRPLTRWEAMAFPDELRRGVADFLGAETEVVHARQAPLPEEPETPTRFLLLCAAALFAMTLSTRVLGPKAGEVARLVLWIIPAAVSIAAAVVLFSRAPEVRRNGVPLVFPLTDALALPVLIGARWWHALARLGRHYLVARVAWVGALGILSALGALRPSLLPFLALSAAVPAGWCLARARRSATRVLPHRAPRRHRRRRSARASVPSLRA